MRGDDTSKMAAMRLGRGNQESRKVVNDQGLKVVGSVCKVKGSLGKTAVSRRQLGWSGSNQSSTYSNHVSPLTPCTRLSHTASHSHSFGFTAASGLAPRLSSCHVVPILPHPSNRRNQHPISPSDSCIPKKAIVDYIKLIKRSTQASGVVARLIFSYAIAMLSLSPSLHQSEN